MTTPSRVTYLGNGTTRDFTVSVPFIARADIRVLVNNILRVVNVDFVWTGANTIQFLTAPALNDVIEIRRETEILTRLVDFHNGAVLTEEQLDLNTSQLLYLIQELKDTYEGKLNAGLVRLYNGSAATADDMIDAISQQILESALLAELRERVTDIDLNAESILEQTLRLDGIDADFINEQTARVEGDTALAETLALIGAKNGDNTAFVLDTNKVRVNSTTSLATRLSGIDTAVGNNSAAIVTEQNARAAGDSANASSISTLQTTVNGHTSSIQTHQTVLNGISAQYMVKLDVNGYVSGFGLYNQGSSSQFIVIADRFAVVTPGQSPTVPFSIVGGVVYMQNVVISGALIQDLSVGTLKIANGAITNCVSSTDGSTYIIPSHNAWNNMGFVQITVTAGSKVNLWGTMRMSVSGSAGGISNAKVRIIRSNDGAVLSAEHVWPAPSTGAAATQMFTVLAYDPSPPAGTVTYRMQVYAESTAAAGVSSASPFALVALETKK